MPEVNTSIDEKAKDPADFAYVPDEKSPSTWKLDISDPEHIAAAITALSPGGYRGQKVEIPSGDKKAVISKIRARINKIVTDDTKKQNLLDRLNKVKAFEEAGDKAWDGHFISQQEASYVPLSANSGQACANCRWFSAAYDRCMIVEAYPQPILATGWCDRWETSPQPQEMDAEPIPVVIVEPPMMADDSAEMALPTNQKGLRALIVDTVKGILRVQPAEEPAFAVFKAANGQKYWLSRHTGKFKDREKEIIADKAHAEYVERVQKGLVPMPELWVWHKAGSRHGVADMVWKSGGFTLALGHFDDTPEAEKAYTFYEKNRGKIKLSHMFHFPKNAKQKGVYYAYNTVEITTLPDGAEAFPYTSFEEFKPMTLSDKQREFIKGIGGDEMLKRVETADSKAAGDTKTLEDMGVDFKGLDNFDGATIPNESGDIDALKAVHADLDTRLKAVEALPTSIKSLQDTLKAMNEQLLASQKAEAAALERMNDLEKKLVEYSDLQPPASQSRDTLLGERDKSLVAQVIQQAKADNELSLVEKMVGGQPAVTQ